MAPLLVTQTDTSDEDSVNDSDEHSAKRKCNKLPPMTSFDKELLFEEVKKYVSIVESKETDFGSRRKKNDTWQKITRAFCGTAGISYQRTTKQLKKCWENFKRHAKKEVTKHKKAIRETGGGPKPKDLSASAAKVAAIIPTQMNPLRNKFDSDANMDHREDEEFRDERLGAGNSASNFESPDDTDDGIAEKDDHAPILEQVPRTTQPTPDKRKRKYQDVRNSLADMEYEEHKLRLKILVEDFETSKLKRKRAIEELKCSALKTKTEELQYMFAKSKYAPAGGEQSETAAQVD